MWEFLKLYLHLLLHFTRENLNCKKNKLSLLFRELKENLKYQLKQEKSDCFTAAACLAAAPEKKELHKIVSFVNYLQ